MSDLVFTYEPERDNPRQAYRAKVPGLAAKDRAMDASFVVQDISVGGVSLLDPDDKLKMDQSLEFDVLIKEHVLIVGIKAQVTRRDGTLVGLRFNELEQRQEERLDKLVLEVQKHLISKRKSGGSHIDDDSKT